MTVLAVVHLAGAAHADPATPRTLPSGAPACGNVMGKYGAPPPGADPVCAVIRSLRDLGRKFEAELAKLDIKTASLTLAPAPRLPL